ncbi:MAG TPA: hypothetical protein VK009_24830 [Chloroflexota bacterium]|nr:hypothetical protein [Chloroflexota bacterium]
MPEPLVTTGTLYNFDAGSYTCSVQPDGALTTFLKNVPVSRQLTPSLLPNGARVSLLLFDENNPSDAMVVGVTTANLRAPSCRVYRSSAQSIPNASQTALSFSSVRHDTMAGISPMWSAADPTHAIVRTPGLYVATACVEFDTNATGQRVVALFDTLSNQFIAVDERNAVSGDTTDMTVSSGPFYLPAASSFQVLVYQNCGAALNVNAGAAYSPELSVAMIG